MMSDVRRTIATKELESPQRIIDALLNYAGRDTPITIGGAYGLGDFTERMALEGTLIVAADIIALLLEERNK